MANKAPIVQVIQFVPTKECLADPSLFRTVRNVVERWQEKGMKGQYWGPTVEKPTHMYWVLFWQSRAHAAAFAADPLYPHFVWRRQSLATSPVRDHHVTLSGTPLPWIEAPITEIDNYKILNTNIKEGHGAVLCVVRRVRSLRAPGFNGSSYGVTDEDPTVGIYISGWNSVEEHLSLGMGEGRENDKFKEEGEEAMRHMSDLTITHVAFKKHGA